MNDDWMARMSKHSALSNIFDFLVDKKTGTKCLAVRAKATGMEIAFDDQAIEDFIMPEFKTLDEACFYDFGKDMEACRDE